MSPDEEPTLTPRSAQELAAALADSRKYTLGLYAHLTEVQEQFPLLDGINLPRWEVGHIGWFQEYWCLRYRGENGAVVDSRMPHADALWDSSKVPHATRWSLSIPAWTAVHAYLQGTLSDTLDKLAGSADDDRYYFELALYHEDMHGEALLMTLQNLGLPRPANVGAHPSRDEPASGTVGTGDDVWVPGGAVELGTPEGRHRHRFVFDNEIPAYTAVIKPFAMARHCVTNGEFLEFVEDGGYARPELWSQAGREWLLGAGRAAPAYWSTEEPRGGPWLVRTFAARVPLALRHPVQNVNWFEADAWCRWAGRRLPTEAEWEWAARHPLPRDADDRPWQTTAENANLDSARGAPIEVCPLGHGTPTGLAQMLGNVWEWTASVFDGYPGFRPGPYADYSAPWFGTHYVMRGGSWATRGRLVHNRFRNFYPPGRHDPFVGFRTCAL